MQAFSARHELVHQNTVNRFILHVAELQGNTNANRHLEDLKAMFNWGMRQEDLGIALNRFQKNPS